MLGWWRSGRKWVSRNGPWGLYASIVGAFIVCSVAWYQYDKVHQRERQKAADQYNYARFVECVSGGTGASQCLGEIERGRYGESAEVFNLKAQQEMARWALLGFFVTSVGVAYVAWTLRLTATATKAAVDQVEALRRPHLRVRHEHVKGDIVEIAIENSGDAIAEILASDFLVREDKDRPIPRHWSFVEIGGRAPNRLLGKNLAIIGTGNPAGFVYWSAPIPNGAESHALTIMGGIMYRKLGDERTYRTFFCREFDRDRNRFVAIKGNDPEYERED